MSNRFASVVFLSLLLAAAPLAFATHLNVTLLSPLNSTNTTGGTMNFTFLVRNQTSASSDGVGGFIKAELWIANVSDLPAGVAGIAWGSNKTNNSTAVVNASEQGIALGLRPGVYVWNVNVSTSDAFNFSQKNFTMTIDQTNATVNRGELVATWAMLTNFGFPVANTTFVTQLGRRATKPILNITTFLINISEARPGVGVASVQIRNATALNGNPGAWVFGAIQAGDAFAGTWGVTLNLSNASNQFWNFTVNVTDYAGNSYVFNLTGKGNVVPESFADQGQFQSASLTAEYYINNFPTIQGKVIDMRTGQPLNGSAQTRAAEYNVSVVAKRENFGQLAATTFNPQFPIDEFGEFIAVFNETSSLPVFGGGGGPGGPSMYRFYATVTGPNGNVSRVSAFSMPQPLGFVAPPGRPQGNRNLYVSPAQTILLAAQNATAQCSNFFGMVMDSVSGVPIRFIDNSSTSGPCTASSWLEIIIASNKNYSITIGNPPFNGGTPFPPRTISITTQNLSDSDESDYNGVRLNVTVNTSFTLVTVNFSLFINNGTPTTPAATNVSCANATAGGIQPNCANFTKFEAYMSFSGFVPPMEPAASRNATELTTTLGNNGIRYGTANASMTVPSGVVYTIFAYAEANNTFFMGIAQINPSANTNMNMTLYRLAGQSGRGQQSLGGGGIGVGGPPGPQGEGGYQGGTSGGFNTSMTTIRFVNENGTLLSDTSDPTKNQQSGSDINAEVETNYSGVLVRKQYRSQSQASINAPLLAGEQVKIRAYAMNNIPVERTISGTLVSANETLNITLKRPEMRRPRTGGVENSTISTARIDFLISNSTCNTPNFPASCRLNHLRKEAENASRFNTESEMVSGVVNILITDTSTNISAYLVGLDLSATSMPNMEMDATPFEQSSGGGLRQDVRRVGSFLPGGMVSAIWVGNPINSTAVNASASVGNKSNLSMNIPYLYDDDGNLQWNASRNATTQIPPQYADYPGFYAGHAANNTNLSGIVCWTAYNSTIKCWVDTASNSTWVQLPHFSTVAVSLVGQTISAAASTPSSASPAAGTGGSLGGGPGLFTAIATPVPTAAATARPTATTPAATAPPAVTGTPTPAPVTPAQTTQAIAQARAAIQAAGESVSSDVLAQANELLRLAQQLDTEGRFAAAAAYADQARQLIEAARAAGVRPTAAPRAAGVGLDPLVILVIGLVVLGGLAYIYAQRRK